MKKIFIGLRYVHQNISNRPFMSAPKQEKWIYRNKEKLNVKFIWAVGGVFDFFSGIFLPVPARAKSVKLALQITGSALG